MVCLLPHGSGMGGGPYRGCGPPSKSPLLPLLLVPESTTAGPYIGRGAGSPDDEPDELAPRPDDDPPPLDEVLDDPPLVDPPDDEVEEEEELEVSSFPPHATMAVAPAKTNA